MSVLTIPNTFSTGAVITAASHNANNAAIATEYNAHAVQTDVSKVITAAQTFSGGITGNVTGNLTGNVTGNVTGAVTGNVTGNASGSAATLATARLINGVSFNGSADITVPAAAATLTGILKPANGALAADFTTTSGTAVDVGLAFTLGIAEVWEFLADVNFVTPAGGSTLAVAVTGTVTGAGSLAGQLTAAGVGTQRGALPLSASTQVTNFAGTVRVAVRVVGGASGGTVKLQANSLTATQTTTIGAGSGFFATRIA